MGVLGKSPVRSGLGRLVAVAVAFVLPNCPVVAEPAPQSENVQESRLLSIEASVQYTLANNPQLAALREQHGLAAAGVVVAKTYPFNPIYQGIYQEAQGPSGTVTNPFPQQHQVTLEIELFH